MTVAERQARIADLDRQAEAALASGDDWRANELLRERRLLADSLRDPEELLAEGIALARLAAQISDVRDS